MDYLHVKGKCTNNQALRSRILKFKYFICELVIPQRAYIKIGWTGYFWMIDDMKIVETPDNKIDLTEITHGGWYTTPTTNGFGLDYTSVPLKQMIQSIYF